MNKKEHLSKIFHLLESFLTALLLSIALYCLSGILYQHFTGTLFFPFGYRPVMILSGSMEEELQTGSIVIVKQTKEVKENDIVFFLTDDHVPVIHRYIATTDKGELITKGDANPMEDSDPVSLDQVFGKVIKVF